MRQARIHVDGNEVLLLGTILGFVPDGDAVQAALSDFGPDAIALGIPPEDLQGLDLMAQSDDVEAMIGDVSTSGDDFGGAPGLEAVFGMGTPRNEPETEEEETPFIGLDPLQEHLMELLSRFGATRVPSPDLEAAHRYAQDHDIALEALDLDDDAHADLFTHHVKLRHIILHNRIQAKILEEPFEQESADALIEAWDARLNRSKPLRAIETAREEHMATRLQAIARRRTVAVVPLARFAGVARHLQGSAGGSTHPDSKPS